MKSRNIYYVFNGLFTTVKQYKGDYRSLAKIVSTTIQKVWMYLYQKRASIQYKYLHYKEISKIKNNLYIVYNLGKVGSTTVYDTLRLKLPHQSLFHVHFLTKAGLKRREIFHGNSNVTLADRQLVQLIKNNPEKRLKIITLVREPVSREISALFESLDIYFPTKHLKNITIEDLQQKMDENTYTHILNWFDEEFKQFLNFNIYQLPFNKSQGYQIYHTEHCDILLIRMENLSTCFQEALYHFTGIHFDTLLHTNVSKYKLSAALNEKFKQQYKTSFNKLEKIYQSEYVQHFYTKQEINAFIKKYCYN